MSIEIDQANAGTTVNDAGSTTVAVTLTEDIAAGATVFVEVGWWHASGTLSSVADDGPGLAWTIDRQGKNATQNPHSAIVRAYTPAGMSIGDVITATFSTSVNGRAAGVSSFTGIDPDDPVIVTTAVTSGATTAWACGSTTIEDGALLIAACDLDPGGTSTITGPSLEAIDVTDGSNVALTVGYRIETSAGSFTIGGTWTAASNHATVAAAYRAAPDAPALPDIAVADTFGSATAGTGENGDTITLSPDAEFAGQAGRRLVLGITFFDGFDAGLLSIADDGPGLAWEVDKLQYGGAGESLQFASAIVSAPFETGTLADTDIITVTFGDSCYCRTICGIILDDVDNDVWVDSTGGDGDDGATVLSAPVTNVVDDVCIVAFGGALHIIGSSTPAAGYDEQFDFTHADDDITVTMVTQTVGEVDAQTPGATIEDGDGWVMASVAYRDSDAALPPINQAAPELSGIAQVGQTIECSDGEWIGDPTITYAYQWLRDGEDIDGATASEYLLDAADEDTQIKCTVTATNASGSVNVDSNSVIPYATSPYDVLFRLDSEWVPSTWRVRVSGEWIPPVEA